MSTSRPDILANCLVILTPDERLHELLRIRLDPLRNRLKTVPFQPSPTRPLETHSGATGANAIDDVLYSAPVLLRTRVRKRFPGDGGLA
jgi:hypothetical protein